MGTDCFGGCNADLEWEQSGGESAPAVAETVCRLLARRSAGARPGRTVESVSWGGCEGRGKAGAYGDLMGLAGRGLARHVRLGTCSNIATRSATDVVGGGVAGAEPPHKGGPTRPDRPEMQWSVVSGQWSQRRRSGCLRFDRGVPWFPRPEVCECSSLFWDEPRFGQPFAHVPRLC